MHEPATLLPARRPSCRARPRACRKRARPNSSSSLTATSSSSRSRRSKNGSATRPCGCLPTTAPSPVRRCKVPQGSTITVHVTNHGDIDATVHWHGLRLENRYDGTHDTQAPIPVGETLHLPGARARRRRLLVPPAHPRGLRPGDGPLREHPRHPDDPDYWPPANRELLLTLDDILIEDGQIAAFSESETTHVAMGRFGNVMLVAGEPDLALEAKRGEVVRFYFTNTANTRVFNVTLPGAQMKLVGADAATTSARSSSTRSCSPRPSASSSTCSSRMPASSTLQHRTPERTYRLASITVADEPAGAVVRGRVRGAADEPRHGRATRAHRAVP